MTSKERIQLILDESMEYDESVCYVTSEDADALREAIKALGNTEKYRWHDLRKNPEDLPEEDVRVLVYVKWEEGDSECYTDYYYRNHWAIDNVSLNAKYIAWKYFEPFEEKK